MGFVMSHYGKMNTFTTYLFSLLGVIAIVFRNHAQKWGQICCKSVQLVRGSSFRNGLLQNPYFKFRIWNCFWLKSNKITNKQKRLVKLVRLFRIAHVNAEIFEFVVWELVVGSGKQKFYSHNYKFFKHNMMTLNRDM